MTNVHAWMHKSTDADPLVLAVPMVDLCIHGGGDKYGRGLTIADDRLPSVQRLKLLLDECYGDSDDDERSDTDEDNDSSAYVTADSQTVAGAVINAAEATSRAYLTADSQDATVAASNSAENTASRGPVVDMMDVREVASGCLKRSSQSEKPPAKKPKSDADGSRDNTAAAKDSADAATVAGRDSQII